MSVYGIYNPDIGFGSAGAMIGNISGWQYAAVGAFTGSAGLPTRIDSVSDWQVYAEALVSKTDQVDNANTSLSVSNCLSKFLLVGGPGDDALSGNDTDSGAGTLLGRDGNDTVTGGNGADRIAAGSGADSLNGGAGIDRLFGNNGNDALTTSGDGDYLNGAQGADTFVFTNFLASTVANISNLQDGVGGDTIDLSGAAAALGFDHFTQVRHFGQEPVGEMKVELSDGGRTILKFNTSGDKHADFKIVINHGDHTGFDNFIGVDTSGMQPRTANDHGGLVT